MTEQEKSIAEVLKHRYSDWVVVVCIFLFIVCRGATKVLVYAIVSCVFLFGVWWSIVRKRFYRALRKELKNETNL